MERVKKRIFHNRRSLFNIYLRHILLLGVEILVELLVFIVGINLVINTGGLNRASYAEHYLSDHQEEIRNGSDLETMNLPVNCQYGLYTLDNEYKGGSLSEKQITEMQKYLQDGEKTGSYFYDIRRADERCIIFYDVAIHFSDPEWNARFPHVELLSIYGFLIIFVLIIIWNAHTFGKRIKMELQPLVEEIQQIGQQDISFEQKNSEILEFNRVLEALYQMKTALSESMKQQWSAEHKRKTNMSALAHDIKTPLTVIKGNAELISEEEELSEIYDLADGVNQNADKIEKYLGLLLQEMKNEQRSEEKSESTITAITDELKKQIDQLCTSTQIPVEIKTEDNRELQNQEKPISVQIDLLNRAVLNIVRNAIRYTDPKSGISVILRQDNRTLSIIVEDYGEGFTSEALAHATDQFYTGDKERSGEHYGLGLYLVKTVTEAYHGAITFYNKEDKTGSIVTMTLNF